MRKMKNKNKNKGAVHTRSAAHLTISNDLSTTKYIYTGI